MCFAYAARNYRAKKAIGEKWDESSQSYESYHGHGIKSDEEREAWKQALQSVQGMGHLSVLDAGCGTSEISLLLAEMGHQGTNGGIEGELWWNIEQWQKE